jgi:integrase
MHADGGGLCLRVRGEQRAWLLRYQLQGQRHEMGLGTLADVSLAQARTMAAEARKLLALSQDPLQARRHAAAAASRVMTFRQAAQAFLEDRRGTWRSAKHEAQWGSTLEAYAYPHLGYLPVSAIQDADVLNVLRPIWRTKLETASRVRGRIEAILDWAAAQHMRSGPNPAVWRGVLSAVLPPKSRVARVEHHAALPYAEIGAFMAELRKQEGIAARALEFAILTATRTSETLLARWDEIDMERSLWLIPAGRTKRNRDAALDRRHLAPLCHGQAAPCR